MKRLIRVLKVPTGFALLTLFLFVAFQFKANRSSGDSGSLISAKSTHPAYPSPEQATLSAQIETNSDPYPGPDGTSNIRQTVDCTNLGAWVEYTNEEAGFSFQYPAESTINESLDNNSYTTIDIFLRPYCYTSKWWGPNKVTLAVVDNSANLTIEDFILNQYNHSASTLNHELSLELEKNSESITIDQTPALRLNGVITRQTPHVYIPYNDHVIFIGLVETTLMPPFESACSTTLDLYNKILASVNLFHQ